MGDAEIGLHRDGGRRKGVVRRRGGEHDEIDRLRIKMRMRERGARGVRGHVRGDSPGAAMRRSWMPVRCTIHSSDVSTLLASSALVRTWFGR